MILPRIDKEGNYYISYSQITAWHEAKGFDTGLSGKVEFIRKYFLGETFEDTKGFGTFGTQVEGYITERNYADKFTDKEKQVLEQIKPLGIFQKEFKIQYDGFYVLGYIDDALPDYTKIRDYKTASKKSGKKYEEDDYFQLDLYALGIKKEFGKLPKSLEICIIERLGNGFNGGRDVMSVGNDVWYVHRTTDKKRLDNLQKKIIATAKEISEYYEVFTKLNIQ
jgi:hypothetical protein